MTCELTIAIRSGFYINSHVSTVLYAVKKTFSTLLNLDILHTPESWQFCSFPICDRIWDSRPLRAKIDFF